MAELTTADVCATLGLSPQTVRNLADTGELRCRRTPGGHRRYLETDVAAFDASRGPAPRAAEVRAAVWISAIVALLEQARADVGPSSIALPKLRDAEAALRRP